jgi:drug/metabolite transporter (DMT)-like permease
MTPGNPHHGGEPPTRRQALAGIHVAAVLFGFAGLFARWLPLPAVWIVAGRTGFACLFLGLLLRTGGRTLGPLRPFHVAAFAASGALLALHWLAFFRSIQLGTVALGLFAFSSFPVFLMVLEPLVFRENFRPRSLLLVLLAGGGVALISPPAGPPRQQAALLWGLASGLTFALLILANRGLARAFSGLQIAFWQDLFAFAALAPFCIGRPARLGLGTLAGLSLLGVLCTAVAHSLFISGLKKVSAQTAGMIALAESVYAVLLAMFLFGETPTPAVVLGGALVLSAAIWVTWRP